MAKASYCHDNNGTQYITKGERFCDFCLWSWACWRFCHCPLLHIFLHRYHLPSIKSIFLHLLLFFLLICCQDDVSSKSGWDHWDIWTWSRHLIPPLLLILEPWDSVETTETIDIYLECRIYWDHFCSFWADPWTLLTPLRPLRPLDSGQSLAWGL